MARFGFRKSACKNQVDVVLVGGACGWCQANKVVYNAQEEMTILVVLLSVEVRSYCI